MKKYMKVLCFIALIAVGILAGCGQQNNNSASQNNKMNIDQSQSENQSETSSDTQNKNDKKEIETMHASAFTKDTSVYDIDIAADRAAYNGKADIKVGDHMFSTQINDWYMNFDQYAGKVVEIEGYYINEFAPYDFVGRYGPQCPYCQGGYVCFEIVSDQDLSGYENAKDWIKVTGILREGQDQLMGSFYYIEAINIEKMDKVGMDTVVN